MSGVWIIAANELRRTARDRASFFWLLVMPLLLMWMFGSIGGSERDAALGRLLLLPEHLLEARPVDERLAHLEDHGLG